MNTITEQECSFTATAERETVRDVKEKLRFSGLDYDTELYELPDGNIIIVGDKRFRCAEALFQPVSLTTRFHDTFFLSKTKCHVYIRKEVYATVMLSSGTTCAEGTIVRMTKELTTLAPSKMDLKDFGVSHEPIALQIQHHFENPMKQNRICHSLHFFSGCDLCTSFDTLTSHSVSRDSHVPTVLNTYPDFRRFFKGSCLHHSCPHSQMASTCWVWSCDRCFSRGHDPIAREGRDPRPTRLSCSVGFGWTTTQLFNFFFRARILSRRGRSSSSSSH